MDHELYEAAVAAKLNAFAPYSHFRVGAAIRSQDGQIFNGCNVENAAYGSSMCAERNAIFSAITKGQQHFSELVVTADTDGPIAPCGSCRQVIAEFCAPDMPVYLTNKAGIATITNVKSLLPGAFTEEELNSGKS